MKVVHGAVGRYSGVKDRLNCFNFLRQVQILEKAGGDAKQAFTGPRT